jgi:hypothetical protein
MHSRHWSLIDTAHVVGNHKIWWHLIIEMSRMSRPSAGNKCLILPDINVGDDIICCHPRGRTGLRGMEGPRGTTGLSPTGPQGPEGIRGEDGLTGPQGPAGRGSAVK